MLKRVSKTNPPAAGNAGEAAGTAANAELLVRCLTPYAPSAENPPRFPSHPGQTSQYIAANASAHTEDRGTDWVLAV